MTCIPPYPSHPPDDDDEDEIDLSEFDSLLEPKKKQETRT